MQAETRWNTNSADKKYRRCYMFSLMHGCCSIIWLMKEYLMKLLQLNVKDVHLRYEDETCIPGRSFACGVIIRSLSAHSTNENGVSLASTRDPHSLFHALLFLHFTWKQNFLCNDQCNNELPTCWQHRLLSGTQSLSWFQTCIELMGWSI